MPSPAGGALAMRLEAALSRLEKSSKTLSQLEEEHETFLNEYYRVVGARFEELARLEQQLAALQEKMMPVASAIAREQAMPPEEKSPHRREMEQHIKQLYRSMVRDYHPDIAGKSSGRLEAMQAIGDAYARRNLADLWRAKWQFESALLEDDDALARQWQQHLAHIEQWQLQLQTQLEELQHSSAHALMQRALQLKLCGQDFIAIVRDNVQQQIEEKRRGVVIAKIKLGSLRLTQQAGAD